MGFSFMKRSDYTTLMFEKIIYSTIFSGLILLCFGSIYYHFDPNNFTMVWDRLPMTMIFSSLFSIIVWDFVDRKSGQMTFIVLLPAGILSVLYWWYSEMNGMGDLRPYIFMQFFPMICLPFILIFSFSKKNVSMLGMVLVFYVLAKIFELYDLKVLEILGYSGHSLKHIFAAIATYFIYAYMKERVKIQI